MSEKKENKDSKNTTDDLLDDLLGSSSLPAPMEGDLPAYQETKPYEYAEVSSAMTKQAKKMVTSVLKLYLSADLIDQNDFVKASAEIHNMQLSSLLNQMAKMEHIIDKMMVNIDNGEVRDRTFEVLGGLHKTQLEINKNLTLHMVAIREQVKSSKHDLDIYDDNKPTKSSENEIQIQDQDGNTIRRGTRNMMKDLQNEINPTEVEDVNIEDEDE